MARSKKLTVDYFPHYFNHGMKMRYLRRKYPNCAYRVWFMLLEELGKTVLHYLDINDELKLLDILNEFDIEEETFFGIIELLVKLKELDKNLWENHRLIFNQTFANSLEPLYKKRVSKPPTAKDALRHFLNGMEIKPPLSYGNDDKQTKESEDNNIKSTQTLQSDAETHQSIVKHSKTYQSIAEHSKEESVTESLPAVSEQENLPAAAFEKNAGLENQNSHVPSQSDYAKLVREKFAIPSPQANEFWEKMQKVNWTHNGQPIQHWEKWVIKTLIADFQEAQMASFTTDSNDLPWAG